jgi:hypothetical protein
MTNDIQVILFCFVNYHSFAHIQSVWAAQQQKPVLKRNCMDEKENSWWLHISYDMWLAATALILCVCIWICHCCCCFFVHMPLMSECRVRLFFVQGHFFAINFMHSLSHSCCTFSCICDTYFLWLWLFTRDCTSGYSK